MKGKSFPSIDFLYNVNWKERNKHSFEKRIDKHSIHLKVMGFSS